MVGAAGESGACGLWDGGGTRSVPEAQGGGGGGHRGVVDGTGSGLVPLWEAEAGLPTNLLGGGGGGLEHLFQPPAPLEGAPRASSLLSIFFMHVSNHWFLISRSKTALPLVGAMIQLPHPRCQKLEMQAQTSARPVTMLVPICHTGGEQTAALEIAGGKMSGICIEEISL